MYLCFCLLFFYSLIYLSVILTPKVQVKFHQAGCGIVGVHARKVKKVRQNVRGVRIEEEPAYEEDPVDYFWLTFVHVKRNLDWEVCQKRVEHEETEKVPLAVDCQIRIDDVDEKCSSDHPFESFRHFFHHLFIDNSIVSKTGVFFWVLQQSL